MHWNHRVMRQVVDGEEFFSIREVFYDDDGSIGEGWTADPIAPLSETVGGLREELQRMLEACDKPVLEDVE